MDLSKLSLEPAAHRPHGSAGTDGVRQSLATPRVDLAPAGADSPTTPAETGGAPQKQEGCPTDGVAFWALRRFIKQHETKVNGETTTRDVCFELVKPATGAQKCASYVDLIRGDTLDGGGSPAVAHATLFVSHAWACPFQELFAAVEAHISQHVSGAARDSVYLWIDIFTVNQHNVESCAGPACGCGTTRPAPKSKWWAESFEQAIDGIGSAVAVLHPWNQPEMLTRAWCLWELFCVSGGGSAGGESSMAAAAGRQHRLEVALSPTQRRAFIDALTVDFDSIEQNISRIDSRNATAFLLDDYEMIHEKVAQRGGHEAVNERVSELLLVWLIGCGYNALFEMSSEAERMYLMTNLARMLERRGRGDEAAILFGMAEMHGASSFNSSMNWQHRLQEDLHRVALLIKLGRISEAEPIAWAALQTSRRQLDPMHELALAASGKWATILMARKKYSEVEEELSVVLALRREEVLGDKHEDTLSAANNLAIVIQTMNELPRAESLALEVFLGRKDRLGPRHPDSLHSAHFLAMVLAKQGRLAEAEPLLRETRNLRREVKGRHHAQTLTSVRALAEVLMQRTRLTTGLFGAAGGGGGGDDTAAAPADVAASSVENLLDDPQAAIKEVIELAQEHERATRAAGGVGAVDHEAARKFEGDIAQFFSELREVGFDVQAEGNNVFA